MSFDALKEELANLNVERRHEIVAYLVSMDDQSNEAYRADLTQKIDDKNPAHWLTLDEMDRRLEIKDTE